MVLLDRNNTAVFKTIKDTLEKIQVDTKSIFLPHQQLIQKFFESTEFGDTRGLICYHKYGTGKTLLSAGIIKQFNTIYILANRSLHENFMNDLKKAGIKKENVNFIAMNAYNLAEKFPKNFSEGLLVVDEAHNLFNSITSGGKNATSIYYHLRNNPNIKVIFLTGSPIINNPFEIMTCFNMLRKPIKPLIPETFSEFNEMFIKPKLEGQEEKYKFVLSKLGNRIVGMVSFFENPIDNNFPTDLGLEIVECEMTGTQLEQYFIYKKIEMEQDKKVFMKSGDRYISLVKNPSKKMSSYKIRTRLLCNRYSKDKISDCHKYKEIIKRLLKPAVIYSEFTNENGLGGMVEFLKEKKINYYMMTGEISFEERTRIQDLFNKGGGVLLVSSVGAEGLNLKKVRTIHIMESYWNNSRLDQIKARGIRYQSHIDLPSEEQNVKTYIYLSTLPNHTTTDWEIYNIAKNGQEIIDDFLDIMKRYSIDCHAHKIVDCAECIVDKDKQLFNENPDIDINLSNPCHQTEAKKELKHVKEDMYEDVKTGQVYKLVNGIYIAI